MTFRYEYKLFNILKINIIILYLNVPLAIYKLL
jgi:hypothetical protein